MKTSVLWFRGTTKPQGNKKYKEQKHGTVFLGSILAPGNS